MTTSPSKICSKCGKDKKESEFYRELASKDKLMSRCKDCIKSNNKGKYKKRNPKSWWV